MSSRIALWAAVAVANGAAVMFGVDVFRDHSFVVTTLYASERENDAGRCGGNPEQRIDEQRIDKQRIDKPPATSGSFVVVGDTGHGKRGLRPGRAPSGSTGEA